MFKLCQVACICALESFSCFTCWISAHGESHLNTVTRESPGDPRSDFHRSHEKLEKIKNWKSQLQNFNKSVPFRIFPWLRQTFRDPQKITQTFCCSPDFKQSLEDTNTPNWQVHSASSSLWTLLRAKLRRRTSSCWMPGKGSAEMAEGCRGQGPYHPFALRQSPWGVDPHHHLAVLEWQFLSWWRMLDSNFYPSNQNTKVTIACMV